MRISYCTHCMLRIFEAHYMLRSFYCVHCMLRIFLCMHLLFEKLDVNADNFLLLSLVAENFMSCVVHWEIFLMDLSAENFFFHSLCVMRIFICALLVLWSFIVPTICYVSFGVHCALSIFCVYNMQWEFLVLSCEHW